MKDQILEITLNDPQTKYLNKEYAQILLSKELVLSFY